MLTIVPTIDVEGMHGMRPFAQMVLGEVDGTRALWGVGKIADICARNAAPATFFVDVYEHVFWGEEVLRDVCRDLTRQGMDVQLHTHPAWRDDPHDFTWLRQLKAQRGFRPQHQDFMTKLDKETQADVLRHGIDKLTTWIGKRPVAHRSGGYSINQDTVAALREVGIGLDSSMYCGHPHSHLAWSRNAVVDREGLLELPVTLLEYAFVLPWAGTVYRKPMKTDVDTCSLDELKAYVLQGRDLGLTLMNLFMHSYSLVDFDVDYRTFVPGRADAEKLDQFLAWAQEQDGVRIMDCAGVLSRYREVPEEFQGPDAVPAVQVNAKIARLAMRKVRNRLRQSGRRLRPVEARVAAGGPPS